MRKKLGAVFFAAVICLCCFVPDVRAEAAAGKTTISVSSKTVNIGESVTVTAKAMGESGETAYANMVLSYDPDILEFQICTATYGGGGGSISVANDSFSVTFKAVAAGKASISLSASDGVIFDTAQELDSVEGSSVSLTVNNAAAGETSGGNSAGTALSADNSLKTLTISPGTLSPSFKGSTTKYTAAVDHSVTNIAVSAVPANDKATVESVTGNTNLAVGNNVIAIVVKAENGTTATYKITVTRQAETAAEEETPQNSEVSLQDTEEVINTEKPDTEEEITVNNAAYHISDSFKDEQIPADFTKAAVNFRGKEYAGLSYDKGTICLLYMETENADEVIGKFFVYDETRDMLYDFVKMTAGENSSVIALLAPLDSVLPENYAQTSLQMYNGTVMTAYRIPSGEDAALSEFYLFYGVNHDGVEGWYQYDSMEGTYQRVSGEITDTDDASDDLAALQEQYEELSKKYKDEKAFARNAVAVFVFIIAALLIVFVNLFFFGKRKAGPEETEGVSDEPEKTHKKVFGFFREPEDLFAEEEDSLEEDDLKETSVQKCEDREEQQENVQETADENEGEDEQPKNEEKAEEILTKEKKNETSVKNEKDLEVWDLNDL